MLRTILTTLIGSDPLEVALTFTPANLYRVPHLKFGLSGAILSKIAGRWGHLNMQIVHPLLHFMNTPEKNASLQFSCDI